MARSQRKSSGCLGCFGLMLAAFVGLFAFVVSTSDHQPKEESNENTDHNKSKDKNRGLTEAELEVKLLNVKRIDKKWRYFFRVTNKGEDTFRDSVTIELTRIDGATTWSDSFSFEKAFIEPNVSKVVYTDANTGMTEDYGEFRITGFTYEIK